VGWGYILKITDKGDSLWSKTLKNKKYGICSQISQTADKGYVITGGTADSIENFDPFLLKLNEQGTTQWEKVFTDKNYDVGNSVGLTMDGGYILSGYKIGDPDITGFLIKTDAYGTFSWKQVYPGGSALNVTQLSDGGFVFVTSKASIIRTGGTGVIDWTGQIKDTDPEWDHFGSGLYVDNNSYVICGSKDAPGLLAEAWLDKFQDSTSIISSVLKQAKNNEIEVGVYPNPFSLSCTFKIPVPAGCNKGFSFSLYDVHGTKVKEIDNITSPEFTIDRNDLPAGLYLYQLSQGTENASTGKLMIR
jgi:hypothetical protein